jgi:uncharacterized protein (UPF0303 family)
MKNLLETIDNIIREVLDKHNITNTINIMLKHNKVSISLLLKFNKNIKEDNIIPMICDIKFNNKEILDVDCEYNSKDNTLYFKENFNIADIYGKESKFKKLKLTYQDSLNILSKF